MAGKAIKTLIIGEMVTIETEKEVLIGRVQNIDVNSNFVVLNSVRDFKHKVNYTSHQLIPIQRIKSIRQEADEESSTDVIKSESSEESYCNAEHLHAATKSNKPNQLPKILLTPYELQLLQKQIGAVKILSVAGSDYNDAIADIKSRNCIALDVQPFQSGRSRKTCVITIATEHSIYVFDIVSLGKVLEDLKAILRADRPCKAMHNSRLLVDQFEYRHSLKLGGISDTVVAYCIITNHKKYIDLEDVVVQYFNIPADYFERQDESYIMFRRPLSERFIRNCAKRAAFIFKLNENLQKNMLRKYYNECKKFSRSYADNKDASEVADLIEKKDDSCFQHIQALDLDDQRLRFDI